MFTGNCLCGDIAFEIGGKMDIVGHCHCSMCRKYHGSAFATVGTIAREDFRWVRGADRVRAYRSSAKRCRHFCPRCGSVVPTIGAGQPFALVPVGNVAEDPENRPHLHFFTGSKAPWHNIVDDLPQHPAYAPDFGTDLVAEDRRPREPRTPGPIGGSCLCGAVVFEFDGPPLRMYNCHCSRCRLAVSAAYQTVLRAHLSGFRWLAGREKVAGYRMPETRFECAFCTVCGSRTPWERGEQVCVPAGCLDSDPGQEPSDNIFTASRAAWTVVDERLQTWPEAAAWSRSSHLPRTAS